MSIAQQIDQDYVVAYKAKEQLKLNVLRLLKSAAKNRQVELLRPLEDADWLDVIMRQAKQRQDSIEQYTQAGRQDLAQVEQAELEILRFYLPQALTSQEFDAAVEAAVAPYLEGGMKNMGKAIQDIMAQYKGRVDGKAVSDAVKTRLQKA